MTNSKWRKLKGVAIWRYKMPIGWLVAYDGFLSNTMVYYPHDEWPAKTEKKEY